MALTKEQIKEMAEERKAILEGDPNAHNGILGQERAVLEQAQWEAEAKASKKEFEAAQSEVNIPSSRKAVENTPITRSVESEMAIAPAGVEGDAKVDTGAKAPTTSPNVSSGNDSSGG